jgi:hypothetical protein
MQIAQLGVVLPPGVTVQSVSSSPLHSSTATSFAETDPEALLSI